MNLVYLGLGSNIKDKRKNLESALDELEKVFSISSVSSLYESKPWGYIKQDNFYNAVVLLKVDIEPLKLFSILKGIESKFGRKKEIKWGPRVLDIDLLLYNNEVIDMPNLKIPHPFISERAFVLLPLLELSPGLINPQNKISFHEDLVRLKGNQEIKKIASFNKESFVWHEDI